MKKQFITLAFIAFGATTSFAATWRVNNNVGINANFTTLSAAVTAASNGDIIYVEPSASDYGTGTLTIGKQLTIIGNGGFLSTNTGLQINSNTSNFSGTIVFSAAAAGSVIAGMTIQNNIRLENASNITVKRCYILGSIDMQSTSSNTTIAENYLNSIYCTANCGTNTAVLITNNIVVTNITLDASDVAIIENNSIAFFNANYYSLTLNGNSNVSIRNNIILNGSLGLQGVQNAVFQNNICTCNQLPSGNGNQNSVTGTNIFTNSGVGDDNRAKLKSGSPAIDAGYYGSGDDIGAINNGTGRPTYILGLIPDYPSIYALTGGGTVTTPTMSVTISTRSNN